MAVAFAERPFRLEQVGVDQPSMTISESAGTTRSTVLQRTVRTGLPDQPAGDRHLVDVDGELLRPGEQHRRRATDDDGARHRLAALLVFVANADSRRRRSSREAMRTPSRSLAFSAAR